MTSGLLTVVLATCPVGAPPSDHAVPSGYNPRVVDTAGRAVVEGGEPAQFVESGPAPRCVATLGLVYEPAYCLKNHTHGTTVPYVPQAGDIVFFVSDTPLWPLLYAFALTGEPYHVGVVFQTADGAPALLEAGPPEVAMWVQISPLAERLEQYDGRVFIRRRTSPLTAEQSEALTGFALRQEGKPYAYIRFLLQGTPFRSRGPVRTEWMGKSRGEPSTFFCSELAMEGLVAAGLVDACSARPRATNMQDMFYDESPNPYIDKTLKLYPCWDPPQQWVAETCPGTPAGTDGR